MLPKSPLITNTSACELQGLVPGTLYHFAHIYRTEFSDGTLGTPILEMDPKDYPTPAVYVDKDSFFYYFKPVRSLDIYFSDCKYYIYGSPYVQDKHNCQIAISRTKLCGAKFEHKGHNSWFDIYEYSKFIDSMEPDELNKLVVVARSRYNPVNGIETDICTFNPDFAKQHKILRFMNMSTGFSKDYNMQDLEVLHESITGPININIQDLDNGKVMSKDNILTIVVEKEGFYGK